MNRRELLKTLGVGAGLSALGFVDTRSLKAAEATAAAAKGSGPIKITKVRTIITRPARVNLIVVKVETSEPGLYGLGCATFNQRPTPVLAAVQDFLDPFSRGRDPDNIEDLWQNAYTSSYWRNGPVLNNALSGLDMALWDIKGKRAGLPVYQLLGGKCRFAVDCYSHASGRDVKEIEDSVRSKLEQGYRHVRIQMARMDRSICPTKRTFAMPGLACRRTTSWNRCLICVRRSKCLNMCAEFSRTSSCCTISTSGSSPAMPFDC